MKKALNYFLMGILLLATYDTIWASVQTDLEKANKKGNTVFLVVSEPGVTGLDKAVNIAEQARKSVTKSTVIEMNRADSTNSQLVKKYRLAGAPLPLILVVASNGAAAGGLPADRATPEGLVKIIPSPKQAEVFQALSENKSVFVVASRKSMTGRAKVFDTCKAACSQMKNNAVFVSIDMDDKKESSFLAQLKVNTLSTEPVTAVINNQRRITGSFNGSVEVTKLVDAAAKKAGGCCPGGSKKGCAPSNQKGK
ncbi:MAG: hypothetical protein ACYTFE_05790 [Planctomycetota bacterium]|jgi:hypothetical protein